MQLNPKDIEGRGYQPVILGGGLDQVTSKFNVYPGSLQDCLNYESSDTGYTRSQGLLFFDGTYDSAVEDMWYVGAEINPTADATMNDTNLAFTIGDRATWGVDSSGIVVYWNITFGAADYIELGLVEVIGNAPAAGDVITDGSSGAVLTLDAGMAYPPVTLVNAVNPSTAVSIADDIATYLAYINGTVNASVAGQAYVPGSLQFHGKIPGVGAVTGGFQYKDYVYGVRDHYSVGFYSGDTEILLDSDVVISMAGNIFRGTVARTILQSGEWTDGDATGSLVLKPRAALSTAWANTTVYALYDLVSNDGIDYVCTLAHTSTDGTDKPGEDTPGWLTKWDVNDIKTVVDAVVTEQILNTSNAQIALVDPANTVYKGCLWKATIDGWEAVNTGYTIEYDTGTNSPNVATQPLFLTDVVSGSILAASGFIAGTNPTEQGSAPLTAWTAPSNVTADDAAYATCALAPGSKSTYLIVDVPTTTVPDNEVKILGVEVKINAKYTTTVGPVDAVVQLMNEATGEQYLSANLATETPVTAADADYTFGFNRDLWGLDDGIDPQDILDGNLKFRVQYRNDDAGAQTIAVDYISVQVHYVRLVQHAYFYDGAADLAEADIVAFQILDGDFDAGDDALGQMTLYSPTAVNSIMNNQSIYSAASGGGSLIATVTSPPEYNLLPSSAEMDVAGSMYESIVANFREADDGQGVYVVTGASPAFMLEQNYFSFIRTPQWVKHDKPRHLAFHANHLALGFDAGSVIFSAVGVPNDFSGGSGSQWPAGGPVTGLSPLPGDAVLGVWTDRRTMTLVGRDPTTDMSLQVVSDSSGAIEYTVQNIGTPYFADFRGLATVQTTDKFGDFDLGRISFRVTPFLRDRLQTRPSIDTVPKKAIASLTVRNKNQYRLFFQDGYILTMTFFESKAPEFTIQHYDTATFGTAYVPTFVNSFVLANGRERNIMGTDDGSMWIVDGANGIQDSSGLTQVTSYITLNPSNLKRPEGVNKFYHVVVQGQFFGHQQLEAWSDTNYTFNQSGTAHDTIQIGSVTGSPVFESLNNLDSVYTSQIADGYSLKLQTYLDGSKPHTLQSLLFRASAKGVDRNSTTKAY